MKAIIDTNVLLVANGQHADVSPKCVSECIQHLSIIKNGGITVIDDAHHVLSEYLHKTNPNLSKGVGDVFLKWLLRNAGNPAHVEQVSITGDLADGFVEFPDAALQEKFDASDRKFVAVANAHPDKPPIWQAVDCKWLDWWQELRERDISVKFLCQVDICCFYQNKFPLKLVPTFPTD